MQACDILHAMRVIRTSAYKKEVADYYSRRSHVYDKSAWHDRIARRLVERAGIGTDDSVLDIATGTGMVAMHAASLLGPRGSLIGIDISEGMIDIARSKLPDAPTRNMHFEIGDGEALRFPPESFDLILCGSALIWMTDLHSALTHWCSRLKPRGRVGFHAFSEKAFVTGVVAQKVLRKYGVSYLMSKPTGSVEKCRRLLERAGYRNIEIVVDRDGEYIDLDQATMAWEHLRQPAPGQYPHPMARMTAEQMAHVQIDYQRALERLNTDQGIWNDMTTFYVFGEKA